LPVALVAPARGPRHHATPPSRPTQSDRGPWPVDCRRRSARPRRRDMDLSHPSEESLADSFGQADFHARHIGPSPADEARMLERIGCPSRAALVDQTVPAGIRLDRELAIGEPTDAPEALAELAAIAARNERWRNLIGAGYHGTHTPEAIRRNVLENPGWYTAYTPYHAAISQGRPETLRNCPQMAIGPTARPPATA